MLANVHQNFCLFDKKMKKLNLKVESGEKPPKHRENGGGVVRKGDRRHWTEVQDRAGGWRPSECIKCGQLLGGGDHQVR